MKQGGTGGANTNRGGLAFESKTDFASQLVEHKSDQYTVTEVQIPQSVKNSKDKVYAVTRIEDNTMVGMITKQFQFYNLMKEHYGLSNQNHKQWKPDEAFFNFEANTVFIVEKKWQETSGSVDEKIFGFVNKRRLYQNNFNALSNEPKPTVEFSALFNRDWWINGKNGKNQAAYQDYFDNLRIDGIKIFFDQYDFWWFGL